MLTQSAVRCFCSPEAVNTRAKADQLALREEMAASGQLFDELWRRGYERNADRLVPREETVMEPTSIKFSGDHI